MPSSLSRAAVVLRLGSKLSFGAAKMSAWSQAVSSSATSRALNAAVERLKREQTEPRKVYEYSLRPLQASDMREQHNEDAK
jgi:hypothetical protein